MPGFLKLDPFDQRFHERKDVAEVVGKGVGIDAVQLAAQGNVDDVLEGLLVAVGKRDRVAGKVGEGRALHGREVGARRDGVLDLAHKRARLRLKVRDLGIRGIAPELDKLVVEAVVGVGLDLVGHAVARHSPRRKHGHDIVAAEIVVDVGIAGVVDACVDRRRRLEGVGIDAGVRGAEPACEVGREDVGHRGAAAVATDPVLHLAGAAKVRRRVEGVRRRAAPTIVLPRCLVGTVDGNVFSPAAKCQAGIGRVALHNDSHQRVGIRAVAYRLLAPHKGSVALGVVVERHVTNLLKAELSQGRRTKTVGIFGKRRGHELHRHERQLVVALRGVREEPRIGVIGAVVEQLARRVGAVVLDGDEAIVFDRRGLGGNRKNPQHKGHKQAGGHCEPVRSSRRFRRHQCADAHIRSFSRVLRVSG